MRRIVLLLSASMACLSACGGLQFTPVTSERRSIHPEHDATKTLTVTAAGMEWYDGSHAAHGVRFPGGVYVLEGEDDDYWYLRSSTPLEFKDYRKGGKIETRSIPGGIMVGKYLFRPIPAGGYVDGEGATRVLVWKLTSEFIKREGKDWKKSF